ncbi:MAG: family 16 glycosylhydrolase [Cyclobacteriaceae bacterium]|nr:family 16 glycosylhydrolase [Cyclobacteriaceae bacterium]
MKTYPILLSTILMGVIFSGCKESDAPKIVTVGNLIVETTITADGSGLVTFKATADNATKFTFYFGEGLDAPLTMVTGNSSHMYLSSGTYSVRVQAYSADNLSVEKTFNVTVHVNELPISNMGYVSPTSYAGLSLVWEDEFTGDQLNLANWNYEIGPFNNELQYYKQENTTVKDGYLIIKAKIEKKEGKIYTSSRLTTQNKKTFKYGRIDIRAMMPKGKGLFPALWMLGSTFSTVGWPKCGEIDIMETIGGGGRDSVTYGTAHWEFNGQHVSYGGHKGLQDGKVLGDQFHVFSILWTQTEIKWYIDDVKYHTIDITPADLVPFTKDFFFIFNVAVGGEWAGSPDDTTVFPQRMVVDYVRVFQ